MLLIIQILSLLSFTFHDIHISKTEINYKTEKQALQLSVNMFIDDLELAVMQAGGEKMNLFEKNEIITSDSLIASYIQDHLRITVDNNPVEYFYLGKELSDDLQASWCYLELEGLEAFDNIEIENDIMLELYDDQKNIVNVLINSKSKAFHILDKGLISKSINL